MESHDTVPQNLPKMKVTTLVVVAIVIVLGFGAFFVLGYIPRHNNIVERERLAQQAADTKPVVQVGNAKSTDATVTVSLPADVRPWAQTALFARITGYLNYWDPKNDIGARVKKDQVLAIISAPDTDADLAQAQANLDQAKATVNQQQVNAELADATLKRYQGLIATGGVTQQQLDQFTTNKNQADAALVAAQAAVKSSGASVDRLLALTKFEKIVAPFDGTITARNYDNGALISANDTAAGHELFDIAADDTLRVFVNVPQSYSTLLKIGAEVNLTVKNYPGRQFPGKIARTAGVLDPNTRTLRTELDFDNADHALYAGMYGESNIQIVREHPVLTIPTSAMLFEANGTQVALVQEGKIHFQPITVGRDFGTEIEALTGLNGSEQVVTNPGENIAEGVEVTVAAEGSPAGPGGQPVKSASTQPSGTRVAEGSLEK